MSYYRRTRNRLTGTKITVGKATALGVDDADGPWVTICDDHGSICNHETLKLARSHAVVPEWCEDCQPRIYKEPTP